MKKIIMIIVLVVFLLLDNVNASGGFEFSHGSSKNAHNFERWPEYTRKSLHDLMEEGAIIRDSCPKNQTVYWTPYQTDYYLIPMMCCSCKTDKNSVCYHEMVDWFNRTVHQMPLNQRWSVMTQLRVMLTRRTNDTEDTISLWRDPLNVTEALHHIVKEHVYLADLRVEPSDPDDDDNLEELEDYEEDIEEGHNHTNHHINFESLNFTDTSRYDPFEEFDGMQWYLDPATHIEHHLLDSASEYELYKQIQKGTYHQVHNKINGTFVASKNDPPELHHRHANHHHHVPPAKVSSKRKRRSLQQNIEHMVNFHRHANKDNRTKVYVDDDGGLLSETFVGFMRVTKHGKEIYSENDVRKPYLNRNAFAQMSSIFMEAGLGDGFKQSLEMNFEKHFNMQVVYYTFINTEGGSTTKYKNNATHLFLYPHVKAHWPHLNETETADLSGNLDYHKHFDQSGIVDILVDLDHNIDERAYLMAFTEVDDAIHQSGLSTFVSEANSVLNYLSHNISAELEALWLDHVADNKTLSKRLSKISTKLTGVQSNTTLATTKATEAKTTAAEAKTTATEAKNTATDAKTTATEAMTKATAAFKASNNSTSLQQQNVSK